MRGNIAMPVACVALHRLCSAGFGARNAAPGWRHCDFAATP